MDGGTNTGTIVGAYKTISGCGCYMGGHLIGYTTGAQIKNITELFDLKNIFETEGGMPVYIELIGNITATSFRGETNNNASAVDQNSITIKNCRFLDITGDTTLTVDSGKTINLYTGYNNTLRGKSEAKLTISGNGIVNVGVDTGGLKHFFIDAAGTTVAADGIGNITKETYYFVVKSGDNTNRNQEVWVLNTPVFNGNVSGFLTTTEMGIVSGTLTGDYTVDVSGTVTEYTSNRATFAGIVSGGINGSITATINSNGIDTLSGMITGTGAVETVRIIGIFPQSGIAGEFTGEIITGPVPAYVEEMTVEAISGDAIVNVGDTLQMTVTVSPEGVSDEVAWSLWTSEGVSTDIAQITDAIIMDNKQYLTYAAKYRDC